MITRTAITCPTPITPSTPTIGPGTSGPVATGMVAGVSHSINQIAAIAALLGANGGGGFGIISGLVLSASTALNVAVSIGIGLMDTPLELVNSGPFGIYQVLVPAVYTCADNAVNFIWLTKTGALVGSTSLTPPTNSRIYLGAVTTVSGAVTGIDFSGVVSVSGGRFTRQTADIGPPTDSPPAGMSLQTLTTTGVYQWQGAYHARQSIPPNVQTIAATLTLTPLSARQQFLTASGGDQTVLLPDPALLPPGDTFEIHNVGASRNVLVKDHTGATTYITVATGLSTANATQLLGGSVVFPTAWTAAAPGASGTLYKLSGSGAVVTATASETQSAVANLAANTLGLGSILRVTYQGSVNNAHPADTVTVRLRFGATTLSGTILIGGAATTAVGAEVFQGVALLTCRAAPSASSAIVGSAEYNDPTQIIGAASRQQGFMASTNFATNAALLVEITIQFSSSNATNSAQVDQLMVELL